MIVLSAEHVRALLPMAEAIEIVQSAMIGVSEGKPTMPLRSVVGVGGPNKLGIMPGVLEDFGVYGVKILSLFPDNPAKGLSSHIGAMVLFDPATGAPSGMINADALTAIRTAAATAAATRALTRADSARLAIVGTGEQAENHVASILAVADITTITIAGRSKSKAEQFIAHIGPQYPNVLFLAADGAQEAVADADIVVTATSSANVVLRGDWISPGAHVNAVGASIPSMQEIDQALVMKSNLYVDYIPSALAQAKELIDGIASGAFDDSHIRGEIGDLYAGKLAGRTGPRDITLYRSLGVAAQDLAAAAHVLAKAKETGIGTVATL